MCENTLGSGVIRVCMQEHVRCVSPGVGLWEQMCVPRKACASASGRRWWGSGACVAVCTGVISCGTCSSVFVSVEVRLHVFVSPD